MEMYFHAVIVQTPGLTRVWSYIPGRKRSVTRYADDDLPVLAEKMSSLDKDVPASWHVL